MKRTARTQTEISNSIIAGLEEASLHAQGHLELKQRTIRIAPLPEFSGNQIKRIRVALGLTQSMLAKILGVSVKTIEAWESGRNAPAGPSRRMLSILKKSPGLLKQLEIVMEK